MVSPKVPAGHVADSDRDHCQLVYQNVFVTFTVGPATPENIESLVRHLGEFFAGLGGGRRGAFILVTKGMAEPPRAESRAPVMRVFAENADKLAALAVVIDVPGFAGAALRAVASTLFLLAQRRLPVRFFRDGRDCASWVAAEAALPAAHVAALLDQAEAIVRGRR